MCSHPVKSSAIFFVASCLSFSTATMAQSTPPAIGQYICPGNVLIPIQALAYPPGSVPQNMQLRIGVPAKIVRVEVQKDSRNRAQAYILLEGHSVQFYAYPPEFGSPAKSSCGSSGTNDLTSGTPRPSSLKKPDWPQPVTPPAGNQEPELLQTLQGKYQETDPPERLMDLVWKTILVKCQRPSEKEPSIFYESLSIEADRGTAPQGNFESQTIQTIAITEFGGPFRIVTSPVKRDFSPAEVRNTGIQWSIESHFISTTYRTAVLRLVNWDARKIIDGRFSYKRLWSPWSDTKSLGTLDFTITRDKSGLHFDKSLWHPMSCDVTSTGDDPFPSYTVNVRK